MMDINEFKEKVMKFKPLFLPISFILVFFLIVILASIGELNILIGVIILGFIVWYLYHKFMLPINVASIRNELRKKK